MIRKAFIMFLHEGQEAEYRRRHNPIWPELEKTLIVHGVHNYSIFLDAKTRHLFAYAEIEDEARWQQITQTEICRKWWAAIRDLMQSHADNSPVAVELPEIFHLD